ncbi:MAG: HAD family hydrolase [Dongiaceae bacterium]
MSEPVLRYPRAVLFDWDNTLVDSWAVIHEVLNHTLEAFGQAPWSRDDIELRVRASLRDSFPSLFGAEWPKAEKLFYDYFGEIHLSHLRPLPGAENLLAALAATGTYLGVVSNKRGSFLRKEAAHLGWNRYFQALAGAGDAARDKPAREHVDIALAGANIAPGADVWFVGDTDIDLACAVNAGCVPVLLRQNPPVTGEFDAHPPALYLSGCPALTEYLTRL